jgi:hypothetical protein
VRGDPQGTRLLDCDDALLLELLEEIQVVRLA